LEDRQSGRGLEEKEDWTFFSGSGAYIRRVQIKKELSRLEGKAAYWLCRSTTSKVGPGSRTHSFGNIQHWALVFSSWDALGQVISLS
jgi:hypothetical protein